MDYAATLRELLAYRDDYIEGCGHEDCDHGRDLARIAELIDALEGRMRRSLRLPA
jgi:hypothetical protein